MNELNLPAYGVKLRGTREKPEILDFLRRRYVALTPEEWVRQHFTHWLVEHKGYPQGLCKAKKFYYVTTSGGFIGDLDFGFQYAKALTTKLYGIPDVECIRKEGLDIVAAK